MKQGDEGVQILGTRGEERRGAYGCRRSAAACSIASPTSTSTAASTAACTAACTAASILTAAGRRSANAADASAAGVHGDWHEHR